MSPDGKDNPGPVFVTFKDCRDTHLSIERRLSRIEAINVAALISALGTIAAIVLAVWRLKGF